MNKFEFLETTVKDIHTVVMATSDDEGNPVTAAIDMMKHEDNKLYFLTAKGKSFYKRLKNNENISFTGIKGEDTMSSIAVSFKGKAREIGPAKLGSIYHQNPYMLEIYPTEKSREALTVFEIYEGIGDFFDLSRKPLYRKNFVFNMDAELKPAYLITDKCVACGSCASVCPTSCISEGNPYVINQESCLHCGNCYDACKYDAIDKS